MYVCVYVIRLRFECLIKIPLGPRPQNLEGECLRGGGGVVRDGGDFKQPC